ncbi:sideroflexin-1-like [Saccoglossus kowalevskii]
MAVKSVSGITETYGAGDFAVSQIKANLDEPKWDQNTYQGRAKHFFTVTNPLNVLLSGKQLDEAKTLVQLYKQGRLPATVTEDELWRAKYRSQVSHIQWINQSFNAIVNYTNRSGEDPIPVSQLVKSYFLATSGALITALGLNSLVKKAPPLIGRYVPFAAVATANCINIPMMRMREVENGITVMDENGNKLGVSKAAARSAIAQVVFSRVAMAIPAMGIPPIIMGILEKKPFLQQYKFMRAPVQVGLVGLCGVFATPLCCALFPQKSSISVSKLEPELQEQIKNMDSSITKVYFNKGL